MCMCVWICITHKCWEWDINCHHHLTTHPSFYSWTTAAHEVSHVLLLFEDLNCLPCEIKRVACTHTYIQTYTHMHTHYNSYVYMFVCHEKLLQWKMRWMKWRGKRRSRRNRKGEWQKWKSKFIPVLTNWLVIVCARVFYMSVNGHAHNLIDYCTGESGELITVQWESEGWGEGGSGGKQMWWRYCHN